MKKPKKAVGYVVDIPIPGTDLVISKDFQKERIRSYAEREKLELVGIYEDEHYKEDFMNRPGLKSALEAGPGVDTFLVERVWCLSRKRKELEPFLKVLDQRGIKLECASYLWDCLSQMVRHRYMGVLAQKQRECALALVESKSGKKVAA